MTKKSLGSRIRELREEHDLSVREFAKQLDGISAAHVSDIELGRRFPSDDLLKRMARLLGVPFSELDGLDHRPPIEELKRMAERNPEYGFALRKAAEMKPEDFIKLLEKKKGDSENTK